MPDGTTGQFVRRAGLTRYFDVSAPWLVACARAAAAPDRSRRSTASTSRSPRATFAGRRIRLRQVDRGAPSWSVSIRRRRADPVRRQRHGDRAARRRRALRRRMQMIFQDPYASSIRAGACSTSSPSRSARLDRGTAPTGEAGRRAAAPGRLTPADGGSSRTSSPAAAPAYRDRRARWPASPNSGVRRADLGARRLGAGADPQP